MLGAKLERLVPMVPLFDGTGIGIALFSYDGLISVGLNADYDLVPDLASFASLLAQAFDQLEDALLGAEGSRSKEAPAAPRPAEITKLPRVARPASTGRSRERGNTPSRPRTQLQ
jgi:hypothetical protein